MTHVLCPNCGQPLRITSIRQTLLDSADTITFSQSRPYCGHCRKTWHAAELTDRGACRAPAGMAQAQLDGFTDLTPRKDWTS
jgi:hypothetical protein